MLTIPDGRLSAPKTPTESYLHVLHALLLRDMRTRFGGSMWGYGVVVLWPCVHLLVLLTIYTLQHIPIPLGDSGPRFFFSGLMPVLIFQYVSREVMKAVIQNRPLTYYPQVKIFDLVFSRVMVEIVTGFLALIFMMSLLTAVGSDVVPGDLFEAMCCYVSAILLGIGIGTINVAIIAFFPGWLIGYTLFSILMYIASGALFMPNYMPQLVFEIMMYNPATNLVQWMRAAFYPGFEGGASPLYVNLFALASLSLGLYLIKTVVGKSQL